MNSNLILIFGGYTLVTEANQKQNFGGNEI